MIRRGVVSPNSSRALRSSSSRSASCSLLALPVRRVLAEEDRVRDQDAAQVGVTVGGCGPERAGQGLYGLIPALEGLDEVLAGALGREVDHVAREDLELDPSVHVFVARDQLDHFVALLERRGPSRRS